MIINKYKGLEMKKITGFILVLLVVLLAVPFGFGFWADARLKSLLDDFSQASVLDFTVIKTNRGWFTSSMVVEADVSGELAQKINNVSGDADSNSSKLIMKNTVYHGPLPFMSGVFSLNPVIAVVDTKFIKDVGSEEPLVNMDYSIKTKLSVVGDTSVLLDIPEWTGPLGKDDANVEWKGLSGTIDLKKGIDEVEMDINAPLLKITSETNTLIAESFSLKSSSHKGIAGLSLGDMNFSIGNIKFDDSVKATAFSIKNTSITVDSSEAGSNINSDINFKMGKLNIAGAEYGPAVFSMAFRNLEANAIARINDKINELQQGNIPKDQMGMMIGAAFMSELSVLLKQGPEIEISELSLASSAGAMTGNARITVDVSKPELLSNPFLVKDAILGELDFEVAEELLIELNMGIVKKELKAANIQYSDDQLKAMAKARVSKNMGRMVAAKIFTKVGNMYKISASFEKGIPTVNGSVFNIPLGGPPPQ